MGVAGRAGRGRLGGLIRGVSRRGLAGCRKTGHFRETTMRTILNLAGGGAAALGLASAAAAQQSVSINLQGVRLANGVNESRSSSPSTVSAAYRYHYHVDGMVHGTGFLSYLSLTFPNPTPL